MGLSVGQILRLRIFSRQNDQLGLNVLHYQVDGITGTGITVAEAATVFSNEFADNYKGLMVETAEYRGVSAQTIYPGAFSEQVYDSTGHGIGTVEGAPLPYQTCGLISWRTGFGGHKYRGRTYVPFPGVADQSTDGTPIADYVTRLADLADDLHGPHTFSGAGGSNTFRLIISNNPIGTFTVVTAFLANDRWATQRRRGMFGQPNTFPV